MYRLLAKLAELAEIIAEHRMPEVLREPSSARLPSETQRGGMFQREPGDTYGLDNLVAFETKPEPELSV